MAHAHDDVPLFGASPERSDGLSLAAAAAPRPPPPLWRRRAGKSPRPGALVAAGAALALLGLALVAAGAAAAAGALRAPPPPPGAPRAAAAAPLDALEPPPPGSVVDCAVALGDLDAYTAFAEEAERSAYGRRVANMSVDDAAAALAALPPRALPVAFWVLASPAHPWSDAFIAAAAAQLGVLRAAYAASRLDFRAAGVHAVPATDADVERCADAAGDSETLAARLLAALDHAAALHVVVCEPAGVNGAAAVAGGAAGGAAGAPAAGALLRRSALWQSRTSLVHQLGHALGLAHPFPDAPSCAADADAVADTPVQPRPAAGCGAADAAAPPLCGPAPRGLAPADMPQHGFMELTGDACRAHLTIGQRLRAGAMLPAARPALAAAVADLRRAEPLPQAGAFQSAPPPAGALRAQLAALEGAGGSVPLPSGAPLPPRLAEGAGRLASALEHAAGGAGASVALEDCACAGPDAAGDVFWAAELEERFFVDAVRVLRPWQLAAAAAEEGGGDAGAAGDADGGGERAAPEVEIRVGDALLPASNVRCGAPARLTGLGVTVECGEPLAGRYVSVSLLRDGDAFAAEAGAPVLCVCGVAALARVAPPRRAPPADGVPPGGPLPLAAATRSSDGEGGAAAAEALSPALAGAAARRCSATAAEAAPWWAAELPAGDDGWVTALRLEVPHACMTAPEEEETEAESKDAPKPVTAAANAPSGAFVAAFAGARLACTAPAPLALSVYVTDAPLSKSELAGGGASAARGLCARRVAVAPGRPALVACGAPLRGRVVTVIAAPARPAPLALCSVQALGALELPLSFAAAVAAGPAAAAAGAAGAAAAAALALAAAGDARSCLPAGAPARWRLAPAAARALVAVGAAGAGSAARAALLDAAGAELWAAPLPFSAAGAAAPAPVPPSVAAAAAFLQLDGFSSLCEVVLLAEPVAAAALLDPAAAVGAGAGAGAGAAGAPAPALRAGAGWAAAAAGAPAPAAVDASYLSCADVPAGAVLRVALGGARRVAAVELLLAAPAAGVEVGLLPADAAPADDEAAWGAAARCGAAAAAAAFETAAFDCAGGGAAAVGTLLVRAPEAVAVCDVGVRG
jgi:hypothetical protein